MRVFGTVATWAFGDVEGFADVAAEDFSDYDGAEEEDDFESFWVLQFDAGEVGFVDCYFLEVPE